MGIFPPNERQDLGLRGVRIFEPEGASFHTKANNERSSLIANVTEGENYPEKKELL